MKCIYCDGTGTHQEDHGMGQVELLGCQECMGTGTAPKLCQSCDGTGEDPNWWGCSNSQCCGRPTPCNTCNGYGYDTTPTEGIWASK